MCWPSLHPVRLWEKTAGLCECLPFHLVYTLHQIWPACFCCTGWRYKAEKSIPQINPYKWASATCRLFIVNIHAYQKQHMLLALFTVLFNCVHGEKYLYQAEERRNCEYIWFNLLFSLLWENMVFLHTSFLLICPNMTYLKISFYYFM